MRCIARRLDVRVMSVVLRNSASGLRAIQRYIIGITPL